MKKMPDPFAFRGLVSRALCESGRHHAGKMCVLYHSLPVFAMCLLAVACSERTEDSDYVAAKAGECVKYGIPAETEWQDLGVVITPGKVGSWDSRLGGMISPAAVIRKDSRYFLYYIGADGDRSTDGGPRHRALGVATSSDGINFEKYSANPVIRFLPYQNEEEGVFSAAVVVDGNKRVLMYYSSCDAGNHTSENVQCDGRLAVSENGLEFDDMGVVLSHSNSAVWGYGDEIFPIGVYRNDKQWFVFYIAKGAGLRWGIKEYWHKFLVYVGLRSNAFWDLGVASGVNKVQLVKTAPLPNTSNTVGGGSLVRLVNGKIALFLMRGFKQRVIEVRLIQPDMPQTAATLLTSYNFNDLLHATVFYNKQSDHWLMYYLNSAANAIKLKRSVGIETACNR